MTRKITPAGAHCAIGPDGLIDIDMLRRGRASAESAAKTIKGVAWAILARQGWQVFPVRIVPAGEPDPESVAAPVPPPTGLRADAAARLAPAAGRRVLVTADARAGMLRCGRGRVKESADA